MGLRQERVVAYYSLAPTGVRRGELPSGSMAAGYAPPFRAPARPPRTRFRPPGQGLGGQLLVEAHARIVRASDQGAGRVIVVDAIDDAAAAFYRRHDFRPVGGANRLVMKVATARAALAR